MKKEIGPFKLYEYQPNDICYGAIYTMDVLLPLFYYPKRTVRVYVPEHYDESKKYPLMVMSDGQNMVDKFTSAYGAWEIDKRQHELGKEFLIVGIDCPIGPGERAMEYSFPFVRILEKEEGVYTNLHQLKFESHLLYEYIAKELLPLVKKYFSVSENIEDIAPCGSSMGGVYALSLLLSYPEDFGTALCFSPGYFLYDEKEVNDYISSRILLLSEKHRFFFYSGNVGFESNFLERTIKMEEFLRKNLKFKNKTKLIVDLNGEHNEKTWSTHFNECVRYWLKV